MQFFKRMGWNSPSWKSEFFAGKRSTNDLRKVIRASKFFGVPVGYLIGESAEAMDGQTLSLLSVWREIDESDRKLVLQVATELHSRAQKQSDAPDSEADDENDGASGRNKPAGRGPQKRKPK